MIVGPLLFYSVVAQYRNLKEYTMSTSRDAARSAIFSSKPRVREVTLENGVLVEVRQPQVGQMLDLISIEDNKIRMARMLVACCYVKDTGEALFEDTDGPSLMSLPSGDGPYQELMDAVQLNMGIGAQVEEAEKK